MTRILKMTMKGFKSFGKKVELNFGKGFNCVVGPNGAGKSNIMDALCFVLGKGSAKGLRAEKSANLIYNGGKKKEPAKYGEVSIFFDNSKKVFPTEDDVVKITRIIKSSGQSVYKINDKTRTRQQVLDLLSIANIDPDGYNIILQGDIIKLVEMSPLERRYIIEDIAGISVYEEKKKKAMNELNKVEERINEAEIILSERENYLKELKKDRDQALKYKDVADKLKRSKATYLSLKIKKNKEKMKGLEKNIERYSRQLKESEENIKELRKLIEEKKNEERQISKEIEEKGEKEQIKIMKAIEQLKVDIATNKTRIGSHEQELLRIAERKNQLQKSLAELESKISELESRKKLLIKEQEKSRKELMNIEKSIEKFRKKHKLLDSEKLETDMDKIDSEIEQKQEELQKLVEEQQKLLREKDKLELMLGSLDEKIAKVAEIEKENKAELDKLKQMKKEFKNATLELNKLLNDDSATAAQLGNAKEKLFSIENELTSLKAKNNVIKQKTADNIAVKSIIESKRRFGKVYGTIAELGKVSSKYSMALEVAAGPRIKSIVVDSDKTAAECIKFLKKNKLGTATFLPLNKLREADSAIDPAILKASGVLGRAVDLISYEPKLKKAFSYVFGSTIIVENIDVARRIGIGSARMVSLDGDLAELSGAMHGGFRKKRQGLGFQEKELSAGIAKLEKEAESYSRLVSKLEEKRKANEEKIQRLRKLKASLEGEIIKTEKSLHLDSEDLSMTKKEKSELAKQLKDVEKRMFGVDSKVMSMNSELTKLKIQKQQLRSKITEMKNPRVLAELNAFEQKKTELKESIIKLSSDEKNIEMQIKNIIAPEKENTIKVLSQHDKDEKNFREEIKAIAERIKIQEKELKEKERKQKEFYGKYKGLFAKKDKLNAEAQKLETKALKLEELSRAAEHKKNSSEIALAGIRAELEELNEEIKPFKDISLLRGKTADELKKEIWSLERKLEAAGNVNMRALEVYDKIEKEYKGLLEKKDRLLEEKGQVMLMIDEIEAKKTKLFMETFEKISSNFKEMFSKLAPKGSAFLELENPKEPLSEGLRIKVRISSKKFLDIRSLSGGEKTLTALAFIFAIQEYEPASFYVFDEVDAALDKRNASKFSKLVSKYSEKAQYIIISHNDGVITEADTLYGVSMSEHNISKVVSLKV